MILQFIFNVVLIITGFYLGKKAGLKEGYDRGARDIIEKFTK